MGPERLSSEIGKLIARICRGHKLPADWQSKDFVDLITSYKNLVEVMREQQTGTAAPNLDDLMKVGRPGAYEGMVERAKMKERSTKERGKKPRRKPDLDTDTEE